MTYSDLSLLDGAQLMATQSIELCLNYAVSHVFNEYVSFLHSSLLINSAEIFNSLENIRSLFNKYQKINSLLRNLNNKPIKSKLICMTPCIIKY